jgi:hypothetical protein
VGSAVGTGVGAGVGSAVGTGVGAGVGSAVGTGVGEGVGDWNHNITSSKMAHFVFKCNKEDLSYSSGFMWTIIQALQEWVLVLALE